MCNVFIEFHYIFHCTLFFSGFYSIFDVMSILITGIEKQKYDSEHRIDISFY